MKDSDFLSDNGHLKSTRNDRHHSESFRQFDVSEEKSALRIEEVFKERKPAAGESFSFVSAKTQRTRAPSNSWFTATRVYRLAMGISGNQEDAEEAMQQTSLKVHQHLGQFQQLSKFTTWMTRIALNEALQIRRRRRPTVSLDDPCVTDEESMPRQLRDWHDDPSKSYDKQQIREIVESAIQSLPSIYRETFVLQDVQGLTSEESAAAFGIGLSALKTRLLNLVPHFPKPTFRKAAQLPQNTDVPA